MSSEQAMKITLAAYAIGLAGIVYSQRNEPFAGTYRRVWGLTVLAAGASILSDVAPKAVGPYMLLVAIVFLIAPSSGLGKLFTGAEKSAQTGPTTTQKGAAQ